MRLSTKQLDFAYKWSKFISKYYVISTIFAYILLVSLSLFVVFTFDLVSIKDYILNGLMVFIFVGSFVVLSDQILYYVRRTKQIKYHLPDKTMSIIEKEC